ncbi:MAG TPA: ATP-binding protein [Polyangiaceae bacterium]|nr:ATP-binding protein [Polyangiaceae bacterium]
MDLGASVRAEQLRTLYRQSRGLLWVNVAVASLVSVVLWSTTSRVWLVVWVGLNGLVALARVGLSLRYERARPNQAELEAWGRRFLVGSIAAGALWGIASVVFFDAAGATSELVFGFAIGGMTAAAAGTWSCHLPVFWGYFATALGPMLARTFAVGDAAHLAMGSMLLAYGAFLPRVARSNHESFTRAFRLALENSQLLERLSLSQKGLEETNRTLEQRVAQRSAELERQSEILRDAQRLEVVSRLAGGIAHEFNNLLTIVLTSVDVLDDARSFDAGAIESTRVAARRGAYLARQLLTFGGRQRIEPRVLDCNRAAADMEPLLRRHIGDRIHTRFALSAEPLYVLADPAQLEQILVSLVNNARDAMPEGGELRVSTERVDELPGAARPQASHALLRIEDTGVGMDAETLRRAFDPFFSTKAPGFGCGLGLATVHGIVEQNGGRVSVESEPGRGSRFLVYLPIAASASSTERPLEVPPALPLPATILVAEDEPTLRSLIRRSLVRSGHTVLTAADGELALAAARAHSGPIDLLVTDVVMPNLGGAETARTLALERPGIGVLFMSGYNWGEPLLPSDPTKAIAYLEKPFDTRTLEARVSELLSRLRAPKSSSPLL